MNYLCLDTTTQHAGVTVIKDQNVYCQSIEPMRASETLLKTVDECLKKMELKPTDLHGILVIKGPGSFTGLRVGIAVANQFAHQLKIPIVGLKTDEWWKHRTSEKEFVYLQSMNRGEIYTARYILSQHKEAFSHSIESLDLFKESEDIKMVWGALATEQIKWLGQVKEDHLQQFSEDYQEISDLREVEQTWKKVVDSVDWKNYQDYDLVEPFYGKAPNITPNKKKLGV